MSSLDVRENQASSVDRDAAALLDHILEGLPFGAVVIDRDHTIRIGNHEAARLLELDPKHLAVGTPVVKLIETFMARGSDAGSGTGTDVAHVLAQINVDGAKYTPKTPSGRLITLTSRPMDGKRLITIEDITEQDAEREALKQSAQQMRNLLDWSPCAVAIVRSGGQLLYTNQKHDELYGVTREQMPKNVRELYVDPSQRDRLLEIFQRDGRVLNSEVHTRRPDGGTFWMLLSWIRIEYDGQPALIAWIYDITDRKKAEAAVEEARKAAEQASRTKSDFLANMSHELRTPLNAILGYSEIMLEDATDRADDNAVADLQKIQGAGKHLLGVINDILDLSKIEAGRMDIYLEPVFLPKLVEEVQTMVAPLIGKNDNKLVVECPADIGTLRTDLTKLRQSLINLLSNAAKFTKQGEVKLTLARLTDQPGPARLRFTVSDTGIGMTEEQVGRLFQTFTQADASTTRNFGGSGLGLAITRHFCTMLGGSVEATSKHGEGSAFVITLPDQPMLAAPAPTTEMRKTHVKRTDGALTVLVVDDDQAVHDVLSAILTKEGYEVLFARDGQEALEIMRETPPDIVTLDVMMPEMDGWSLLGIMKSEPELEHIPVIMLTIVDDRNLGFSLGAAEYMTKPIDRSRLIALVQRLGPKDKDGLVLVVDDDVDVRALVKRTLEDAGMRTAEAENGQDALDWLAAHPTPSLVLLDLMMPKMDGFEFLERVRQKSEYIDLPIVVLTAKDLTESERVFLAKNTLLILNKSAQPIGTLGTALAAISGGNARARDRENAQAN